ncbi:MAG TPA: hypothetical protein VN253_12445 [Kofleriaceae bacterium]|nr:hypothetical protein [Kofleriaceae bacterium]
MRRIIMLSALVTVLSLAGGCYATTPGYYGGTITATTVAPDLVYVGPGVQVVADYDDSIFYADNFYWRYDAGRWYRSSWYTGGWVYATPPYAVARIERPYDYRRYRPAGYVTRGGGGGYVRDHRDYRATQPAYRDSRPAYYESRPVYRDTRDVRPAPAPAVRDHRTVPSAPSGAPVLAPGVRDHRTSGSAPARRSNTTVRDHR